MRESKGRIEELNPKKILDQKIAVTLAGQHAKLPPIEVGLRKILNRALTGDMKAVRKIVDECIRADILAPLVQEPYYPLYPVVPKHWCIEEWTANHNKYGLPPWPLEDDGFCEAGRANYRYWRKYGVNLK